MADPGDRLRPRRPGLPIAAAAFKAGLDETLLKEIGPKLQLMERLTSTLLKGDFDEPGLPKLD